MPSNGIVDQSRANLQTNGFGIQKKQRFLKALHLFGGDMAKCAESVGVTYQTVRNHMVSDPQFAHGLNVVKMALGNELVGVAWENAHRRNGFPDRKLLLTNWLRDEFGDTPNVAIQINTDDVSVGVSGVPGVTPPPVPPAVAPTDVKPSHDKA